MSKKMSWEKWNEETQETKERLASAALKSMFGGDNSERDQLLLETYEHSRDLLCKTALTRAGDKDDLLYLSAVSYCRSYQTVMEKGLGDKIPKLSKEGLIDKVVERIEKDEENLNSDELDKMFMETIQGLDEERETFFKQQLKELDPDLTINEIIPVSEEEREQRFVFRNDKGQLLFHAQHVGIQMYFATNRKDDDHLYMYFDVYVGKAGEKLTNDEIRQKLHEFIVKHDTDDKDGITSKALKDLAVKIKKVDKPLYDVNLNTHVYNPDGSVATE